LTGYDRQHRGVRITPQVVCIDAGCGFGGRLCAVRLLPDGRIDEQIEL
jgi:hypothetical protein